jgi:hypothetical protein
MTALTVPFVVIGVAVTVPVFAFGVRRLLGLRVSPLRWVIGGIVALAFASPIITAIGGSIVKRNGRWPFLPAVWFVILGVAIALLLGMLVLVIFEALVPSGTMPGPLYLIRGLRKRARRIRRYSQITSENRAPRDECFCDPNGLGADDSDSDDAVTPFARSGGVANDRFRVGVECRAATARCARLASTRCAAARRHRPASVSARSFALHRGLLGRRLSGADRADGCRASGISRLKVSRVIASGSVPPHGRVPRPSIAAISSADARSQTH